MVFLLPFWAYTQSQRISFEYLNTKDGLPSDGAFEIIQDPQGYIWMCTLNGLVKYDGYEYKIYRSTPDDTLGVSPVGRSFISSLIASDGSIWFGTLQSGFCRYNPQTETFQNHPNPTNVKGSIAKTRHDMLMEDQKGRIWMYEVNVPQQSAQLMYFSPREGQTEKFLSHKLDDKIEFDGYMVESSSGQLLVHHPTQGIYEWIEKESDFQLILPSDLADSTSTLKGQIKQIVLDQEENLWVFTSEGLQVLNLSNKEWNETIPESLPVKNPANIYQDLRGHIWVSGEGTNLAWYHVKQKTWHTVGLDSEEKLGKNFNQFFLNPITENAEGIWFIHDVAEVSVFNRKFFFYDLQSQELVYYGEKFNQAENKPNEFPFAFLIDRSGLLWVGNNGSGINRQTPLMDRISSWNASKSTALGLPLDSLTYVGEDLKGNTWVTGKGGVAKFRPESFDFALFNAASDQTRFNGFVESSEGILWIGSDDGLYELDPIKGTLKRSMDLQSVKGVAIEPLFWDEKGHLWVQYMRKVLGGEYAQSLAIIDPVSSRELRHFVYQQGDTTGLVSNLIMDVMQDKKGRVWVSGFGGLCRYEPDKQQFTQFHHKTEDKNSLSSNFVSFAYQDSKYQIWVGTFDQGMNLYREETNDFAVWNQDEGFLSIITAHESKEGTLWVGTDRGEGLFEMDSEKGPYAFYNQSHGLASEFVQTITEDQLGYLWMPSARGISRFNPYEKHFVTFDADDGFGSYDFENIPTYAQPFCGQNGDVWLNTHTQLFRVQPRKLLQAHSIPPQIVIRSLKIGNEIYGAADGELLKNHVSQTAKLSLAYEQNDLTFEFVGLHYARTEENQYSYKLEGIDDDWSDPSKDRKARYAGLPPGNYTFRVKASNAEGIWSEGNTSIQISIAKAWWQTTAAFIVYFILLAIGVWFFIRWYTRKQEEKIKRQEEELELERQLTEQLRALDQLKDQFLANTSHELRTPLNGIIGLSEGVYDRTDRKTDKEDLELIISSGKRLHHLVDDLLDFSKLRSGEFELECHPVDLSSVIELIFRMSGPAANKKGLSLVNAVPFSLPAVDADPFRLQQILFNLIGNAIKFTEKGEVRIFAEAVGSQVKISVSDTGIGIPQEKLNAIFDAFQQADGSTARKFGGTGLGLTITKQLVSLHGGEIGVNSEIGEGSTFWFTLGASDEEGSIVQISDDELSVLNPSALNGTASAASTPLEFEPVEEFSDSGKLRILIVDDEQVNQRVMKSHLENDRFDLVFADDGDMALDIMRNSPKFDLVLLDVMMPNMSGYEVCKKIREEYLPSELPVIMVTAKNQVNDLVQGLTRGANDYLAKPFSKQEFLARVKTQIDLNQIFSIADRFIPNEFIRTLGHERLTEVQLGDLVEREVSVLFTDIRSYTTLSEGMTPADTFKFINGYTHRMGPIIQDNRGFVNQYLGDGIMAIFQYSPDDALNAMIGMQVKLREYNVERKQKDRPEIAVGMGLHTGPLIMGIIGDSRRTDAATISDTVNTSARMEGLTKSFGVRILISGSSYRGLEEPDQFHFRYIGKVKVKGKNESIEVFECIDGDPQEEFDVKWELKETFDEAVALYYKNHYEESIALTEQILLQNPRDKVAQYFHRKSMEYLKK
ncbi:MAG: ATP-binding protein [Bacteroidota bacterium]